MPNVKHLSMSLSEEEDVSFILNHMQQLEVLNNIKVERKQLFNNTNASQSEDTSQQIMNDSMEQSQISNR